LRPPEGMQPLSGIHLLVVDDDPDARTVMQMVMEYQGALVITAESAKSALALMATVKPNVLVTDINMPQHDGFWLLDEARKRGHMDGVQTLAVTALELTTAQVEEGGFDGYLRKPVDPDDLCGTVQKLGRGRSV
jgi:CheY-like chemotaxis protein